MARIFIDGFSTGDCTAWDYGKSYEMPANRPGFGPYCYRRNSAGEFLRKTLGAQYTELYFKFRLEVIQGTTSAYPVMVFRANNVPIAGVRLTVTTYLPEFYTLNTEGASGATIRATSATALYLYRVYSIEGYIKPVNGATGRFILKVDGTTVIDWTGISTYGTEYVDGITLGNDVSGFPGCYFGDVVLDSADWVGASRVGYKVPSGAGNFAQFTPSAGSNYQNVDEVPVSASDYNYVNSVDQIDSFTTPAAISVGTGGYTVNTVKAYAVTTNVRKTGSPTPAHIRNFIRSGTTDDPQGSFVPGETALAVQSIWELDPATSAAWATNATPEIGYKSQT